MNITCPSCSAAVEVDSSRIPSDGLSMRCPECSHTFQVDPQDGDSTSLGAAGKSSAAERFFVKRPTGKVFGPFDKNAIRMMLEANKLSADAEVSLDKESWKGLAQVSDFEEYASDPDSVFDASPGGTMLGGWASSVAEDDEDDDEDLPQAKPPSLPVSSKGPSLPKPKGGAGLPRPKGDGPGLPKPKGDGPGLPKPKGDGPGLPKPKGGGPGLPMPKSSAELPASKQSAGLPASKGGDSLPRAKGADGLPRPKGPDNLPGSKGGDALPQSKGADALPESKGGDALPQFKGEDALPGSQDDDAMTARFDADEEEDLFAAPVDDEEEDLFGEPGGTTDDEEEDLFGAPADEEEDDLFGAPADEEEDDLFGAPAGAEEDDLFDAPVDDDDDLFDGPDQAAGGDLGAEDSEDLFAAPGAAEDDDDLFESGGLDNDALFEDDGGGDDFLSGDDNFSFLDDSPPETGAEDDLAGQSGEWGDDLMGNAPPEDDFGGGSDFGADGWDDDLGGDQGGLDADVPADPRRPASPGMRQPASPGISQPRSSGASAQTTRDQAVEEDKKRGLMMLVGVPILALLVLGGAGYGLYTTFFADAKKVKQEAAADVGPSEVDLASASSDNYGDMQAVIDEARKGGLKEDEEPKLLLVEALFLTRYEDDDVSAHAGKLADKYADASGGWEALARGAFEAQAGSADAARSYLEPLVGQSGDIAFYANLVMGIGDTLALAAQIAQDDGGQQNSGAAEADEDAGAADEAPEDEDAAEEADQEGDAAASEEDAQQDVEAPKAPEEHVAERKEPVLGDAEQRMAKRARSALETAAELDSSSHIPHYWLGRLSMLGKQRNKALAAWERARELAPEHVATNVAIGRTHYEKGDLNKAIEGLEKVLGDFEALASNRERAEAHHLMGQIHGARQRSDEAISAYTQALSIDASRTETLRALAEEYARAEKHQEALNFFTTNKNLGEEDPEVMLGIVRSHMGLENWDEAIVQLEEGEKLFPDDARFPFYLAKLNRSRGAFFDAKEALERTVEIDPMLLTAHAALAQLAWKIDEDAEAAEEHVAQITKHPDKIDAEVAAEVATYYREMNHAEMAEKWYKAALERNPNYWRARLALARMLLDVGDNERALELLERAKEEGVQDIRLSAYLADAYRQSERYARAIEQINAVLEEHPNNEEYIFIRGRIYFDQGNYDTAREDFNQAYEIDPRFHDAYFYVGRTAFEQEDFSNAMKVFRHVLDYQPNNGEFRYWMGRSYEADNRDTQALEEYRRATSVDDDYGQKNPEMYVRRGRLMTRLGYSVQGKRDIARALELAPDMTEALIAMGEANYREQHYEEAIENFSKIIDEQPDLADVQYKLGMSLIFVDRELEGAKHLQEAVRHGYEDPDVFRRLGYLYKRMRRNQLAIKSFKEYLKRIAEDENVPAESKREMIRQIKELGGSL
jgi:predicted Zn finger-like uncharacterized protein